MSKLHFIYEHEGEKFYAFHCPGCECGHQIPVTGNRKWSWNGSLGSPTFQPSIFVNQGSSNPGSPVCHSYVTEGKIHFLPDCTHKLAGQIVEIPDWNY